MIIRVIKLLTMEKTINVLFVIFTKKIQTSLVDLIKNIVRWPSLEQALCNEFEKNSGIP